MNQALYAHMNNKRKKNKKTKQKKGLKKNNLNTMTQQEKKGDGCLSRQIREAN
jgi:hypothetical protein